MKRYGRLIAFTDKIERRRVGKQQSLRIFMWCRCDCGNEKWVRKDYLEKGSTLSCGCLCKDLAREKGRAQRTEKGYLNWLYGEKRRTCKERDISLELSFDEFSLLVQQKCYYCGDPPIISQSKSHGVVGIQVPINTIDRVDSQKSYIIHNCVPCCRTCNVMKFDLSSSVFTDKIKQIVQHLKINTNQ